jgi:adenosylhomocysteine nucleosidase
MKLAVVAAVKPELRATLRRLRPGAVRADRRTIHESGPLLFAVAGIGAARAEAAARRLIERFRPAALVSTGFAGALADDLTPGDLVIGGSTGFPATDALLQRARAADPAARIAEVVTVDRVVLDLREKRQIHRETLAAAMDMESAAVGRVAREHGAGFLCVKAVLDTPAAPLASSYESVLKVLGEILRRPGRVRRIAADAARARAAAERLATFYAAFAQSAADAP